MLKEYSMEVNLELSHTQMDKVQYVCCIILFPSLQSMPFTLFLPIIPSKNIHTFQFNNGQNWILYASSPVRLTHHLSEITSEAFSGIIQMALLPDSRRKNEAIRDRFSSCYPVSDIAIFREPFMLSISLRRNVQVI
jgi:hypothetical protein